MVKETKLIFSNIVKQPNLWGGIIPMQIFAGLSIYYIFSGQAPNWWWIACLIGYFFIMILGIAIGYHRYLSHKSFETSRLFKILMLWCACLSGQGSPIFWVTVHRGYHHRYSDKDNDPHSPLKGFWHSYILWMFKMKDGDLNIKSSVDLLRDKDCVFMHTHYQKIFWISHLSLAVINFNLWLYLMLLPAFITLHSYSIQTSLSHSKKYGYKNFDQDNDSVNVVWLFPFILGESWHNNHHAEPKDHNFGGRKWWELDPANWVIKIIKN